MPDFTPGETNKNILSVSVIVPCHNEEKNLLSLFEALSVQTYQDFELLLINDHSTDATESIIKNHLPIFKNAVYNTFCGISG
ncbi:MAG TPA: glycosyltransferase family 2 protein, partial [Paludibacteraceae bacterium]|nr:glycosyltransferase family 2 protein [Paludibacteraceae bacterium]